MPHFLDHVIELGELRLLPPVPVARIQQSYLPYLQRTLPSSTLPYTTLSYPTLP